MNLSDSTRNKMSIAKKGNTYAKNRKGSKHTDKTKQKMSESHKGKKHSEETRQKISDAMRKIKL